MVPVIGVGNMSIFDTYNSVKLGNQKITEHFLKTHGFKRIWWGSPRHQGHKEHMCWETNIDWKGENGQLEMVTLYYYPDTFEGYVTSFNSRGVNPANYFFGWNNMSSRDFVIKQKATCKMDYMLVMDSINNFFKTV